MTLRNRELHNRLTNLQECAANAPEGTYERAKEAACVINDCAETIFEIFKAANFKLTGTDGFRDIEAALYGLMLESNPTEYSLQTGEGFGAAMDTPARARVIAQTIRDRDQLKALGL
jgi:hypothetical protein